MNKKTLLSLLIGGVVSLAAFYFSFRHIPLLEIRIYLRTVNYLWMLPTTLVVLLSFAFRAKRWRRIVGYEQPLSYGDAFHPLMIGFTINLLMPGRLGEVARPAILKKRKGIPFSTGLASVAVERIFDLCFLLFFFVLMQLTVDIDPQISMQFGDQTLNRDTLDTIGKGLFAFFLAAIGAILFLCYYRTRKVIINLILRMPALLFFMGNSLQGKVTEKVCLPLVRLIEQMVKGFAMLQDLKNVLHCWLDTCVVWGLAALSYYLMAKGCPGITLNFFEISMVMVIVCFFITLPSVPGFWGLWEAGGIFALSLFGVAGDSAAGYTLVNHVIQLVPVMAVGLVSAALTGIKLTGSIKTEEL